MTTDVISRADLRHIDVWLFDLDNTLYPAEAGFMRLIEQRMTAYMIRLTGLPELEARALQKRYLVDHGTTLFGLMAHHGVDPEVFLDEVHDVSLDILTPDPALSRALARLPGRRLIFTNGSASHADRVLKKLEIDQHFEAVFHISSADYLPKPHPETFQRMVRAHDVDPHVAAFFEDSEHNLAPAAEIGMTTILVGAHAAASTAPFVHYRTHDLAPFLQAALIQETRP